MVGAYLLLAEQSEQANEGICNIGSFGKDVLKIGMTRRLEPMDRVRELGDASVPFTFDVHALIESDDAPNLESTLHRVFEDKRLNRVNRRKEFFKVSIEDIEKELDKMNIDALISKVPSADEYYQSLKITQDYKQFTNDAEHLSNADSAVENA